MARNPSRTGGLRSAAHRSPSPSSVPASSSCFSGSSHSSKASVLRSNTPRTLKVPGGSPDFLAAESEAGLPPLQEFAQLFRDSSSVSREKLKSSLARAEETTPLTLPDRKETLGTGEVPPVRLAERERDRPDSRVDASLPQIGKKEVLAWAEEVTGRENVSFATLKEGGLLLELFALVWPRLVEKHHTLFLESKLASSSPSVFFYPFPQTSSEEKHNWCLIQKVLKDANIPLDFFNRDRIANECVTACYQALVVLFFLYTLAKDHACEFVMALPVDDCVTRFMSSEEPLACLIEAGSVVLTSPRSRDTEPSSTGEKELRSTSKSPALRRSAIREEVELETDTRGSREKGEEPREHREIARERNAFRGPGPALNTEKSLREWRAFKEAKAPRRTLSGVASADRGGKTEEDERQQMKIRYQSEVSPCRSRRRESRAESCEALHEIDSADEKAVPLLEFLKETSRRTLDETLASSELFAVPPRRAVRRSVSSSTPLASRRSRVSLDAVEEEGDSTEGCNLRRGSSLSQGRESGVFKEAEETEETRGRRLCGSPPLPLAASQEERTRKGQQRRARCLSATASRSEDDLDSERRGRHSSSVDDALNVSAAKLSRRTLQKNSLLPQTELFFRATRTNAGPADEDSSSSSLASPSNAHAFSSAAARESSRGAQSEAPRKQKQERGEKPANRRAVGRRSQRSNFDSCDSSSVSDEGEHEAPSREPSEKTYRRSGFYSLHWKEGDGSEKRFRRSPSSPFLTPRETSKSTKPCSSCSASCCSFFGDEKASRASKHLQTRPSARGSQASHSPSCCPLSPRISSPHEPEATATDEEPSNSTFSTSKDSNANASVSNIADSTVTRFPRSTDLPLEACLSVPLERVDWGADRSPASASSFRVKGEKLLQALRFQVSLLASQLSHSEEELRVLRRQGDTLLQREKEEREMEIQRLREKHAVEILELKAAHAAALQKERRRMENRLEQLEDDVAMDVEVIASQGMGAEARQKPGEKDEGSRRQTQQRPSETNGAPRESTRKNPAAEDKASRVAEVPLSDSAKEEGSNTLALEKVQQLQALMTERIACRDQTLKETQAAMHDLQRDCRALRLASERRWIHWRKVSKFREALLFLLSPGASSASSLSSNGELNRETRPTSERSGEAEELHRQARMADGKEAARLLFPTGSSGLKTVEELQCGLAHSDMAENMQALYRSFTSDLVQALQLSLGWSFGPASDAGGGGARTPETPSTDLEKALLVSLAQGLSLLHLERMQRKQREFELLRKVHLATVAEGEASRKEADERRRLGVSGGAGDAETPRGRRDSQGELLAELVGGNVEKEMALEEELKRAKIQNARLQRTNEYLRKKANHILQWKEQNAAFEAECAAAEAAWQRERHRNRESLKDATVFREEPEREKSGSTVATAAEEEFVEGDAREVERRLPSKEGASRLRVKASSKLPSQGADEAAKDSAQGEPGKAACDSPAEHRDSKEECKAHAFPEKRPLRFWIPRLLVEAAEEEEATERDATLLQLLETLGDCEAESPTDRTTTRDSEDLLGEKRLAISPETKSRLLRLFWQMLADFYRYRTQLGESRRQLLRLQDAVETAEAEKELAERRGREDLEAVHASMREEIDQERSKFYRIVGRHRVLLQVTEEQLAARQREERLLQDELAGLTSLLHEAQHKKFAAIL
ncbi:hypothetical protein TGMAS_293170A, partial [Toxoplasma gondii MAS]